MAKIKRKAPSRATDTGTPRYPYCTKPNSLRKFLEQVPNRPKPPKVTGETLKVWGLKDSNDITLLRVVKELGLLSPSGETTEHYAAFMGRGTGSAALGKRVKATYEPLFQNISEPNKASNDELRNFFNIHSGGGERTITLQIETFKAICDHATFDTELSGGATRLGLGDSTASDSSGVTRDDSGSHPAIRIDLHIHLPEHASKTDYESIIESISRHIYRRPS